VGARGKCRGFKVGRNIRNGVRRGVRRVKTGIKQIKRRKLKIYAERDVAAYSSALKL
jgi:hypothetical protein